MVRKSNSIAVYVVVTTITIRRHDYPCPMKRGLVRERWSHESLYERR